MKLHGSEINKQVQEAAKEFIDEYFAEAEKEHDVINNPSKEHMKKLCKEIDIPEKGRDLKEVITQLVEDVYPYGYRVQDEEYMAFIPGPASKLSWLGSMMTESYNRFAGSYMNFPTGTKIEERTIKWCCEKAGFGKDASGLFVSGGSMANLTALIAARDNVLGEEIGKGVAYLSEQTHSSVKKALRIIGIPNKRIHEVPVDDHFRLDPDALNDMVEEDKKNGYEPFVVIANAGATNTGYVDPLEDIADVCRKQKIWLHVDGAFGASVLLSKKHRNLLKGIDRADSISWDGHKWLFQIYPCGICLVRDKKYLLSSFFAHPEYLEDLNLDTREYNTSDMGIELTRPARGLKLWFTLQVAGSDAVGEAIDKGFELAEYFEEQIRKEPDIEIITPAQMAILNFRYAPEGWSEKELDYLNHRVSEKIVEDDIALICTTKLDGKTVLRMCILHPETKKEHIDSIIEKLNGYAREIIDKGL